MTVYKTKLFKDSNSISNDYKWMSINCATSLALFILIFYKLLSRRHSLLFLHKFSQQIFLFALTVTVKYVYGLPQVTVPLPSRNELCQFTLRPITHCVGDFLDMLRSEDRGIDRATILNDSGVRIAAASSIENLMGENFW